MLIAINQIIEGKEKIKRIIESNIEKTLVKNSDEKIINLDQEMIEIQKEVLKKAKNPMIYLQERKNGLFIHIFED